VAEFLPPSLVALDVSHNQLDSTELAGWLQCVADSSRDRITTRTITATITATITTTMR
jgi:hypothetical protein